MSRVRDLTEITSLDDADLFYTVDFSAGPNGGRKITKANLRGTLYSAAEIKTLYEGNPDTNAFTDAEQALVATIPDKLNKSGDTMTGDLDMGGNDITNVATVDGVDISDHSARHDVGGADALTTAAPTTNLSTTSINDSGTPTAYSPNTHTHAFNMAQAADLSTINAGDTESLGSTTRFVDAGHQHPVATAAASQLTPDLVNAEGNSTSLARANHIHNVPSGTPVSTGTANSAGSGSAFAKNDHVHNTVIQNYSATQTTSTTTTSLTDVLMTDMSISNPIAGDYLVNFNASMLNSANGAERNFCSIYVGGVQQAFSAVRVGIAGGAVVPVSTGAKVTVNGSQNIEVYWRVAGGTGTVYQRSIRAMKVG